MRVRSSEIKSYLRVEPPLLLLHVKMSQLRWLGHLIRMLPRHLALEISRACPTERTPEADPEHTGRVTRLIWLGNNLGSLSGSWKMLLVRGKSILLSLSQQSGLGSVPENGPSSDVFKMLDHFLFHCRQKFKPPALFC